MKTTLANYQVLSPSRVVYPVPALGGNDEPFTYRCTPHLEISDLVAERPLVTTNATDGEPVSMAELIDRQPVSVVHPSLRHEYLHGLVFAVVGTAILWGGILAIIWSIRGLMG